MHHVCAQGVDERRINVHYYLASSSNNNQVTSVSRALGLVLSVLFVSFLHTALSLALAVCVSRLTEKNAGAGRRKKNATHLRCFGVAVRLFPSL